ncbi:2-oxoglutarate dehydrogenase E1 component [Vibrio stylophorae]|uniref:oxoglutarate dehydrogenase (succinyl-transferring) n=1 Tax=Vibrio stylophorae TaxID=659351 RepID=A0ABM8ZU85_9VIBR|nr:2-oxoglutarate dehydrogenase E1 component [Vibrio stylophorae]CAH0533879.1 2-oxoglutarate dehydrogenase E1 component [Vibrio stylophorae]
MSSSLMKEWLASSHLAGVNASYVEELYEQYLLDAEAIEPSWRSMFEQLTPPTDSPQEQPHSRVRDYFRRLAKETTFAHHTEVTDPDVEAKHIRVQQLINAYRIRGHQRAKLDPLGLLQPADVADLSLTYHNLTEEDLAIAFPVPSLVKDEQKLTLQEIIAILENVYCGAIGAEYMHITDTEEKAWIQQRLEAERGVSQFTPEQKLTFLEELTAAEGLERYLGAKFPGAKRFSLEGGDALIPMVKELVRRAGEQGTREIVIGMAHRGRLNMLVNVLGKKPTDLFDEFAGKHEDTWGTGDVKYHQGFSADFATPGGDVHLALAFNPSHLEIVNPVVMGSVRARQDRLGDKEGRSVLPITIHGDSAVAGQGVVAETFNMSQARGYRVGGTVRIVVNNQIGFTTSNPRDTRSTQYCTDIAKMVQAPIFHVNADDPEAVAFVTQVAIDYRNTFGRDVVIDLVCYRRHGHNEADEPNATQPLMYQKIKQHPTPRKLYADVLIEQEICDIEKATELVNGYRDALDSGECVVKEWRPMKMHSVDWQPYVGHDWEVPWQSQFAQNRLIELGKKLCQFPESHQLQSRVQKLYQDRQSMLEGTKAYDWGMAELLAYATILDEGSRVRITGQDSGRGTFFHRHAVLHNQADASIYIPLTHLHNGQGHFQVFDSVLSEEAVLAFEYGYATTEPRGLTVWEAQFGDFANGAQVVIDQFISSGEQKWGRLCGLTMLLPHGYEGQGPEHSSARLERYLQLCAEQNIQVVVPSTPAQIYHLLRQQVFRPMRRPLIVMSPKSLLRHPQCISSLEDLSQGQFQPAIAEIDDLEPSAVKRVVFCSGKVYYDLLEQRRKNQQNDVAIVRIEQLYPFPKAQVEAAIAPYAHVRDYVWCQEEPQNQGAWYSSQHNFWSVLPAQSMLHYAGRPASASPAVGYMSVHMKQQKALVEAALTLDHGQEQ